MTLSGFAAAHAKANAVLAGVQLIIGNARCTHNFLVVSKLVCEYLVGRDFIMSYDIHLKIVCASCVANDQMSL